MEQIGLEPGPIWDASAVGEGLACYAPHTFFLNSLFFPSHCFHFFFLLFLSFISFSSLSSSLPPTPAASCSSPQKVSLGIKTPALWIRSSAVRRQWRSLPHWVPFTDRNAVVHPVSLDTPGVVLPALRPTALCLAFTAFLLPVVLPATLSPSCLFAQNSECQDGPGCCGKELVSR